MFTGNSRAAWFRRGVKMLVVVGVAAAYYFCLVAPVAAASDPRTGAENWALGLDTSAFHALLMRADEMPLVYRRALLRRASDEERAAYWIQAIANFRSNRAARGVIESVQQQTVISALEQFVQDKKLTVPLSQRAAAELDSLQPKMIEAFGRSEASVLAGNDLSDRTSGLPIYERLGYFLRGHSDKTWVKLATLSWAISPVHAGYCPNCSCSDQSDWCSGGSSCNLYYPDCCYLVFADCGTLLAYTCDGFCYRNPF
jgi:hypothetical protein